MKHALSFGLAATFALISASASALTKQEAPFTSNHPQVGVRLGYGVLASDPLAGLNPYGIGGGLTFGYTFGRLYLGLTGEYHIGAIDELLNDELTASIGSGMAEIGYDLRINNTWMVRPQIGAGMSMVRIHGCVPLPFDPATADPAAPPPEFCADETEFKPAVAPGVMFMIEDLGGFYGQLGLRYHHIFIDDAPGLESDNLGGILVNAGVGAAW